MYVSTQMYATCRFVFRMRFYGDLSVDGTIVGYMYYVVLGAIRALALRNIEYRLSAILRWSLTHLDLRKPYGIGGD